MNLLKHFLYIVLPLLVFFVSGIDAQSPEQISVSISYDGPAEIQESVVLNREVDPVTEEITYELGNPKLRFTVSLSRALVAGESVTVPLSITGDLDQDDIAAQTIVSAITNTGVTLMNTNSLLPTVSFQGAGAQTAILETTVVNDNMLEADERLNISIADGLSSSSMLSAVKDASNSEVSVTILDDEYTFCFGSPTYLIEESVGTAAIPLNINRGSSSRGFPRDTSVGFGYVDYIATSNLDSEADGKPADYNVVNSTPNFVTLAAGTPNYVLRIPILERRDIREQRAF